MKRVAIRMQSSFAFFLTFAFYIWTVYSHQAGYFGYEQLAEAFLSGQISMKELPKPELLIWSPVPALLLFIPANVLGIPMNSALACIFLGSVLLVLLFVLLRQIIPKSHHPSGLQSSLLILILGFGSYTPILLRRPADYEVAILTGSVFMILSLLLFVRSTTLLKHKSLNASFAVLASMLAFWSRPSFLFVPLLIAGFIIFNNRNNFKKITYTICLPIASVAIPMGIYNHLRFGSIFEFGAKYQLAGIRLKRFSLSWIIPKLQSDLLAHRFFGFFPWTTTGESPFREKMYPNYNLEQNLGLLVAMPWAIVIFIIAWQQRKTLIKALDGRIQVLTIACFSAIGAWIIQLVAVPGTTSRYQGDIAPLLTLTLLTLLISIDKQQLAIKIDFAFIFNLLNIKSILALFFILLYLLSQFGVSKSILILLLLSMLRNESKKLNFKMFMLVSSAWTISVIALTSITVGGWDDFNLLPQGFQWWEVVHNNG